jgi:protein TonB
VNPTLSEPEPPRADERTALEGGAPSPEPPQRAPIAAPPGRGLALPAVLGLIGSIAIHAGLVVLVALAAARPAPVASVESIEIEVFEKPPPPPPPPPEPPPAVKPPAPPRVVEAPPPPRPKPRPKKAPEPPPPPKEAPPPPPALVEELPPPPNDAPPAEPTPDAPVRIGISMSSTTSAGSFAAPVGNTLYGAAPEKAPPPEEVKPYAAPGARYVPPYQVTRLPELVTEIKAPYPEEARRLGLEGQVALRLTIDDEGKVAKAVLIKRAGHGFDEAALAAVKRFRFKPGTVSGEPIITDITYTYTFLLD